MIGTVGLRSAHERINRGGRRGVIVVSIIALRIPADQLVVNTVPSVECEESNGEYTQVGEHSECVPVGKREKELAFIMEFQTWK